MIFNSRPWLTGILAAGMTLFHSCLTRTPVITENNFDTVELAPFVEKDFPYITVCLDARGLGNGFPEFNVVARGLAIQLQNDAYAVFDMDLLRWSVGWTGEFLPMVLPAQVSYKEFLKKNNNELPRILGTPRVATGMYPGWSARQPVFEEVRGQEQLTEGLYWGPIPSEYGEWKGVYVYENQVILSYSVNGVEISEVPGSIRTEGVTGFTRTFRVGKSVDKLYLNLTEVANGSSDEKNGELTFLHHGADSVTVAGVKGGNGTTRFVDNRYGILELPASDTEREFTVMVAQGKDSELSKFKSLFAACNTSLPRYDKGGKARWKQEVITAGVKSPDTAAYVTDVLTLPLPNPWGRNVRVADIDFFSNGDAAVSTYEGDIWLVRGINDRLNRLRWKRFASGFYEPFSLEIFKDQIFIYGKEGIVRLHDLNGDDEADFYENFCNLMQQSTGTREWAADMTMDHEGYFYIAKGGHVTGFKGVLPYLSNPDLTGKWRASTNQSGTVLKISPDGKNLELLATGLRMPYIGLNRGKGVLSASDQQGNFVPASPVYLIEKGNYFGVEVTRHHTPTNEIARPLTWIPHRVDRSSAAQTWIENGKMGPLNNQMIHFSFGRPGAFRVLIDSTSAVPQGGVVPIKIHYPSPVLKGEVSPADGQLYIAGFHNFASNSQGISSLIRMRYTGLPSYMVSGIITGDKGIIISFDSPLDAASVSPSSFFVKRWNYQRTSKYGSGHFRLDGSPGEDIIPVAGAVLSEDGKKLLLVLPDMREADQMEILYRLKSTDGKSLTDGVWLTINHLQPLKPASYGFDNVDPDEILASDYATPDNLQTGVVSVARGAEIFREMACIGCHSPETKTEGMYGPPFQGLYGSTRLLADGTSVEATVDYLKESILDPPRKVVKGYNAEMPSFAGVLTEPDLESVILYIKSLAEKE